MLMTEAVKSSKTSFRFYQTTRYISVDRRLTLVAVRTLNLYKAHKYRIAISRLHRGRT